MNIKTEQTEQGKVYHLTMSEQEIEAIAKLLKYTLRAVAEDNNITTDLRDWCLQEKNRISEGLRDMASMLLTASVLLHQISMNKEESHD